MSIRQNGIAAPCIMGVINVTPDSFFAASRSIGKNEAVDRALKMLSEGAGIIDIGGESTGPGSSDVPAGEEELRVLPVIRELRSGAPGSHISIDTWKARTAQLALAAGADMVNDVTAGRGDPAMLAVIADAGCTYVMMFAKDPSPRAVIRDARYDDILSTIHAFFCERISAAESAGIARENIILDPGLGHFIGSDPAYSWQILKHLEFLADFGLPVLVSPSRKSFTAEEEGQPPSERLPGTLRATTIALEHGASFIRTHDVAETRQTIEQFRNNPARYSQNR
jgi:dihydropteroate synthase